MLDIPFIVQIPAGVYTDGALNNDTLQMIIHAGLMVKFVLAILLFFSIASWAIIFVKVRLFRAIKQETEIFLELFWEERELKKIFTASQQLDFSPIARLFKAGYRELLRIKKIQSTVKPGEYNSMKEDEDANQSKSVMMGNLERSLRKSTIDQINKVERAVGFLATTGNTAPFIGLFGTVWGIMDSFRGIGLKGAANLATVAPGISEALIATAAGLAAAIPAVVAYNFFSRKIVALSAEMDIFTSDFLSIVERQFFKAGILKSENKKGDA